MLSFNFIKFGRQEIGEIVHCLPDKKILPGSPAVTDAPSHPKSAMASPRQCTQSAPTFHPNWFTSVEL